MPLNGSCGIGDVNYPKNKLTTKIICPAVKPYLYPHPVPPRTITVLPTTHMHLAPMACQLSRLYPCRLSRGARLFSSHMIMTVIVSAGHTVTIGFGGV